MAYLAEPAFCGLLNHVTDACGEGVFAIYYSAVLAIGVNNLLPARLLEESSSRTLESLLLLL